MSAPTVVSLAERPDLRERLPFGPGWPEFIFHDPVARRLIRHRRRAARRLGLRGARRARPVAVDRERDEAVYIEPGVWMVHA